MPKLNWLKLLGLSLSLLISSCASVPDVPVCKEITMSRAFCTNTISGKEYFVDDDHPLKNEKTGELETWWDIRYKMIMVPPSSWAEIKSFVVKSCKVSGRCDKNISDWQRTVETIETKIIRK